MLKQILGFVLILNVHATLASLHLNSGNTLIPSKLMRQNFSPQRLIRKRSILAASIPGDSLGEEIFVRGFGNFANLYQNLLVFRVLLSWFPAAQEVSLLQPVFNVCDPYLNVFRGILPPIFGIDLSPLLAFAALQALGGSMVALGAPLPPSLQSAAAVRSTKSVPARHHRAAWRPSLERLLFPDPAPTSACV